MVTLLAGARFGELEYLMVACTPEPKQIPESREQILDSGSIGHQAFCIGLEDSDPQIRA